MTLEEKAAAFDAMAKHLVNQWSDGKFSPWGHILGQGMPHRDTREEAVADLVEWATKRKAKRPWKPVQLEVE